MFGHVEKQSDGQRTNISVYTDEVLTTSYEELSEKISRHVQQPDNDGFLSKLRYSCDLSNAVLSELPSAQHAITEQVVKRRFLKTGPLRHWEIRGVLSRQDLQTSTKNIPSFTLRVVTNVHKSLIKIGPCAAFQGKAPSLSSLVFEMHLRPKALQFANLVGGCADEPTHGVEDFVNELLDGLWHSLRGCQFTSFVSWNEAVVMHLKDSFSRSKFDRYLELEGIRVFSERHEVSELSLQWMHEPPCSKASLHGAFLGATRVLKLRQLRSAEAVKTADVPESVSTHHLLTYTRVSAKLQKGSCI